MNVVVEKLVRRLDGTITTHRKEIAYSTVERIVASRYNGRETTLAIYAKVFCGCDHNKIVDGREVFESSFDSTNVYLEAGK